jgi:hypothetical protein
MPISETDERSRHLPALYRNLALRVLVNALAPLGLYELLIRRGVSDFEALAAGAAIPSLWTIAVFAWRRPCHCCNHSGLDVTERQLFDRV